MIGLRVASGTPNLSMYIWSTCFLFAGKDAVGHGKVAEDGEGCNFLLLVKHCGNHVDDAGELVGLQDFHGSVDGLAVAADDLCKVVDLCFINNTICGNDRDG